MKLRLTRNPKTIAGTFVLLTTNAFLFASYGTFWHVPLPIFLVALAGQTTAVVLLTWGVLEEKKASVHSVGKESEARAHGTI
jgi:hypothetical protein